MNLPAGTLLETKPDLGISIFVYGWDNAINDVSVKMYETIDDKKILMVTGDIFNSEGDPEDIILFYNGKTVVLEKIVFNNINDYFEIIYKP